MAEFENNLHVFLTKQGIPVKGLPRLIEMSKHNLVPIMEGYKKENRSKKFYVCVCTSGHDVSCGNWAWTHSGWVIRVEGKDVLFSKGEWKFNISQIPIFQNTLFIVSKRTKVSECAQDRCDMICISKNRKKLQRGNKYIETNRKRNY